MPNNIAVAGAPRPEEGSGEQAYDVLDCRPEEWRRWVMTYRDGTVRASQFRHDLIRDRANTRLTPSAETVWPEFPTEED